MRSEEEIKARREKLHSLLHIGQEFDIYIKTAQKVHMQNELDFLDWVLEIGRFAKGPRDNIDNIFTNRSLVRHGTVRNTILEEIKKGPRTSKQLQTMFGISQGATHKELADLREMNLIKRKGEGISRAPHVYEIV
jgi:predicted HTH transcriptional regulator